MDAKAEATFHEALEQLRLRHLAFRRAEPDEIREIEAMRFEVVKVEAALSNNPSDSRHLTHLRLRLMERTFYVLRLDYYANAQENLGWMNLFRDWGRSEAFNADYKILRDTLSPQFAAFYEAYIAGYAESDADRPIHHPWLRTSHDRGAGLFMDSGRTEPGAHRSAARSGAGAVDDAKGKSGVDQTYEGPGPGSSDDSGTPNA